MMRNAVLSVEPRSQAAFETLLRIVTPEAKAGDAEKVRNLIEEYRNSGGAVIKVGGAALSEQCGPYIFEDIKILDCLRIPLIIVHGGGNEIDSAMEKKGIEVTKIDGQRVSDSRVIEIAKTVMSRIGFDITQSLIHENIDAQHLLGHGGILRVERISEKLQYVGSITKIKAMGILALAKEGMVPVITPLGFKEEHVFNINADLAAGGIACALGAKKIIFVTNVDGIFDGREWRAEVKVAEINKLIARNHIRGGMIPKVKAAIQAISVGGVQASIVNGKRNNAILAHLFGYNGSGTEITT